MLEGLRSCQEKYIKKATAEKEVALSRAVFLSRIKNVTESFFKKVQVAGKSQQVRNNTIHVFVLTLGEAVMIPAQT